MARDDIKVVHLGQAALRYQAMMNGTVDAAMLMEPFIALAEKHGCHEIVEGFYVGSEMFAPTLERETAAAFSNASTIRECMINANKISHHLIADVPPELGTLTPPIFASHVCATSSPGRTRSTNSSGPMPGCKVGDSSRRGRPTRASSTIGWASNASGKQCRRITRRYVEAWPRRSACPGSAPVLVPRAMTTTPLTMTYSIPIG